MQYITDNRTFHLEFLHRNGLTKMLPLRIDGGPSMPSLPMVSSSGDRTAENGARYLFRETLFVPAPSLMRLVRDLVLHSRMS